MPQNNVFLLDEALCTSLRSFEIIWFCFNLNHAFSHELL